MPGINRWVTKSQSRRCKVAKHTPVPFYPFPTANKLGQSAWESVNMTREKTLRRLEQYMKQGMSKDDALAQLKDSLEPTHSDPANAGKLANSMAIN